MRPYTCAVALLLLVLSAPPVSAADLNEARSLYAAASYEEALAMLSSLESTEHFEEVHELRALCLLALGRNRDAEEAIERLVLYNPTYRVKDADVSPKLVAVFGDVRRRTLPSAARLAYTKAKTSYDAKLWGDAKREFDGLLVLLADPDLATHQAALADLRQLGEGFLRLSEGQFAAEAKQRQEAEAAEQKRIADAAATARATTATPAPTRTSAGAPGAAPPTIRAAGTPSSGAVGTPAPARPSAPSSAPVVFSASDPDVTAPVAQRRVLPRWAPPTRAMGLTTQTGLLEIVTDETGAVVTVRMAKTVTPSYDAALLSAARDWRFIPARRAGQPVWYRQFLEIVLRPPE
jgi:tetratricopeptide (TPR) repeat protein